MINARIVQSLEGDLPASFSELENKIFYRENYTAFGTQVWVPRSAITDTANDPEISGLECWKELNSAFESNPGFDSITLSPS